MLKSFAKPDPFVKHFLWRDGTSVGPAEAALHHIKVRTMKIGYARVSTEDQNLHLQIAALDAAGCSRLFSDHGMSGAQFSRPGLCAALAALRPGDTLVVWRLDRLGRSLRGLVELVEELGERKIEFLSLNECINTTSSGGVLIFHVMAALAQFERSLISERTRAGMDAARGRGIHVGRPRALSEEQTKEAQKMLEVHSVDEVAAKYEVHPRTLSRNLDTTNVSATRAKANDR